MLPHEAAEPRRLCFRNHAPGAVVKELIDHDAIIAEHGPDQLCTRRGDLIDTRFQSDPSYKRLGHIEGVFGRTASNRRRLEFHEYPSFMLVHDGIHGCVDVGYS